MQHELKILSQYFKQILNRNKTFELKKYSLRKGFVILGII